LHFQVRWNKSDWENQTQVAEAIVIKPQRADIVYLGKIHAVEAVSGGGGERTGGRQGGVVGEASCG
jgi:hypothetical protein